MEILLALIVVVDNIQMYDFYESMLLIKTKKMEKSPAFILKQKGISKIERIDSIRLSFMGAIFAKIRINDAEISCDLLILRGILTCENV